MVEVSRRDVGVVGIGNFARAQHIPNLARMDGVSLKAICDVNETTLRTVATQYGVEQAFDSYEQMLSEAQIGSVVLTVRDDLQVQMAVKALMRGLNVYVEKPLSPDPAECEQVVQAQRESDGTIVVGYNKRFSPMYAAIKDILDRHGRARMIHFAMTDDAWRWARGYEPGYLLPLDVCHHFDLLEWLTGGVIDSITARSGSPDNDSILLTTSTGCTATIMFSGSDSMDSPKEYVKVIGERFSMTGEDYVELFIHGLTDEPESLRFAGHIQNTRPYLHRRLMKKQGIVGWRSIRRVAWELFGEHSETTTDPSLLEPAFVPNFVRDQGWFEAMRSFLFDDLEKSEHASAEDASRIARIVTAAVRSRRELTTEPVRTEATAE